SSAPSRSRFLASAVYRVLVRAILKLPLRDTQCGFKAFVREPLLPVVEGLRLDGFSFDVEFLFAAWKRELPIREVEFDVVERRPTRHAILLQSPRMLMDLLKIRFALARELPAKRFHLRDGVSGMAHQLSGAIRHQGEKGDQGFRIQKSGVGEAQKSVRADEASHAQLLSESPRE